MSPELARARSCGHGWATATRRRERRGKRAISLPSSSISLSLAHRDLGADGREKSIDERWKALQNSLSGLFCASLGQMHTLHTTSPARGAFPPTGGLPRLPHNKTHSLRHATLPAERVCTENLTPFLKLLPCPARAAAGIAALLEPHKVFDANWHGLGVHVRWRPGAGVELVLAVQAVLDPVRISAERRRGE